MSRAILNLLAAAAIAAAFAFLAWDMATNWYRLDAASKPKPRPDIVCHEPQHHEMRECGGCH